MKIGIVGLGYVGAVTAACFAEAGHAVVGVDVSEIKVNQINAGETPIQERGLGALISANVESGRLRATTNLIEAWTESEVVVVAVGTPSSENGDVKLDDLTAVLTEIADQLETMDASIYKVIVITSTVPPGTLRLLVQPTLEKSGRRAGVDFGLCFSPEFLREGTAIDDFVRPEKVVIGSDDARATDMLRSLFYPFLSDVTITSPEVAETVKFSANAWHALKVTFANEMGRICRSVGVDSHEVMRIFKSDTKLNISDSYLTPGFAFGGSCLPKDLRTITYRARTLGVSVPVLESILPSNQVHQEFALRRIDAAGVGRILVLGLSFKAGTDDLRESPSVPLVENLIGRGRIVRVYDENIILDRLVGANKKYVHEKLPHIAKILTSDIDEALETTDIIVTARANPAFASLIESVNSSKRIIDLTGVGRGSVTKAHYRGLAW